MFNPLTPMSGTTSEWSVSDQASEWPVSDQARISPYYIHTTSCTQVMRIKKNVNYGITN